MDQGSLNSHGAGDPKAAWADEMGGKKSWRNRLTAREKANSIQEKDGGRRSWRRRLTIREKTYGVAAVVGLVTIAVYLISQDSSLNDVQNLTPLLMTGTPSDLHASDKSGAKPACHSYTKQIPVQFSRHTMGALLQQQPGFKIGVEVGVQAGHFSERVLNDWSNCKHFYLVDLWAEQKAYKDFANVDNDQQEALYQQTKTRLQKFEGKTELTYLRMLSSEAVHHLANESVDYIYVDARHDYCGAKEDIELYWPKLRPGGIMAGHDYVPEEMWRNMGQDWGLCQDGHRDERAVKGAVDEFAEKKNLQVMITSKDQWESWFIRKPDVICTE